MTYSQHPLDNQLLLGRYRVMRLLGEGGMGTVHLARVEGAEGFTRPVVVKRMKSTLRSSEEGNRLFIREAKILSRLQHPAIVGISDFGVENGAHIMVLDYVHGYTLSPWLEYRQRLERPLPVEVCVYVVRRILDALHYAHHFSTEEGREIEIVHRDISPDNVLLDNKGYVHLLDFGIASMRGAEDGQVTQTRGFRGKLGYAAPETVKGERATPLSDQYSAAMVLLEMLTGEPPFPSASIAEAFSRMVNEMPEPPSHFRTDIPAGLDAALLRALGKDPTTRFDSARAFSRRLRAFQGEDDEDVAQQLRDLVEVEFELFPEPLGIEPLRDRELALEKILSVYPAGIDVSAPTERRPYMEPSTLLDDDLGPDADRISPAPPTTKASSQRQIQGLLWGLLVVGGLIAVGLGAAVALLSRGAQAPGEVVVVGGDREMYTAASAAAQPGAQNTGVLDSTAMNVAVPQVEEVLVGTATAPSGSAPAAPPERPRAPRPPPEDPSRRLSRAVQRQSGAFQTCFASHLVAENAPPDAVLHFSVARSGGAAQVNVEPAALAASPLGGCLKAAARQVQFPAMPEDMSFRVPVRARVSKADKGPP